MGLRFIVLTPPERILGHAIGSADHANLVTKFGRKQFPSTLDV